MIDEPEAAWTTVGRLVFDKEIPLSDNIILTQASYSLLAMIRKIDYIHKASRESIVINAIIDPEIPAILSELGFHHGIASTILFNDAPKSSKENQRVYKSRLRRVDYVKKHCDQLVIPLLKNRKIRNSLTHIDEYLLKAMDKKGVGWFIDIAILNRKPGQPRVPVEFAYCRTYIMSEDILLHLDCEIPLWKLREETCLLLFALFGITAPNISIQ